MKKRIALLLVCLMLGMTACAPQKAPETTSAAETDAALSQPQLAGEITEIILKGTEVTVNGDHGAVSLTNDIIYYEDRQTYESGNPYGEGEAHERHSAQEAAEHLVVNITKPGNYRLSGELTLGQIRIDLGEDAYDSPEAVVNLILDGVNINCTVAPAILFLNVYECDGDWSTDTARAEVDTTAAGANLILASGSENIVNGSHVAKIYKDKDGEKKLWKQDGAIYSYMSMNVAGSGTLDLCADNEGLDTELHLTINGGNLNIRSDNDGINTNEDGVSVTTINGGNIHIIAGLGEEGDGIDSNGYLVINGGTVVSSANPAADAGLDSDLGSYINGGTVIALGSAMDWAESDSDQVTMNLQFSQMRSSGSSIAVTKEDGSLVFAYDPGEDEVLAENVRAYMGAVISCPGFAVGERYRVYMNGTIAGSETGGIYAESATLEDGTQQSYSSTDVMMGPGGRPPFEGGQRPEDGRGQQPDGEMPTMPEGETFPQGEWPERGQTPPDGEIPTMPEGQVPPDGFGQMGKMPGGQTPPGEFDPLGQTPNEGENNFLFFMQDKVNFFSGLTDVIE